MYRKYPKWDKILDAYAAHCTYSHKALERNTCAKNVRTKEEKACIPWVIFSNHYIFQKRPILALKRKPKSSWHVDGYVSLAYIIRLRNLWWTIDDGKCDCTQRHIGLSSRHEVTIKDESVYLEDRETDTNQCSIKHASIANIWMKRSNWYTYLTFSEIKSSELKWIPVACLAYSCQLLRWWNCINIVWTFTVHQSKPIWLSSCHNNRFTTYMRT